MDIQDLTTELEAAGVTVDAARLAYETDPERRAELSGKAINDLPDSAFAYIEPGGSKDPEGKTVPRSLRHFPIHDEPHVRNALSRAPQSPFGDKAMPKIMAAAKKMGIEVGEGKSADFLGEAAGSQRQARRKGRHRATPLLPEVRHFRATGRVEVRASSDGSEITLEGKPIIYAEPYTVTDMFGPFTETMHPGVATRVLERPDSDVRFLFNHDGLPLARTVPGTLELIDTDTAMNFRAHLDARQQLSNDLAIAIERGDLTQMSVGFIVARDEWGEAEDELETRDIFEFEDLLDVSAVTYPASPTTNIQVAQRMALEMPVESRARLRRIAVELRAGRVLSSANEKMLRTALSALTAADIALDNVDGALDQGQAAISNVLEIANPDPDGDGTEGGTTSDGTSGGIVPPGGAQDGTGMRTARALTLQLEARRHRRRIAA